MKRSNKLLLGGFLAVVLLITFIHITLFAKYKAGNYTIYNAEDELAPQSMQMLPNVLFVTVRNVPDAAVKFDDAARVEKISDSEIQYIQRGDTLLITGSGHHNDMRDRIAFHVPRNATLSVFNSSLSFGSAKKGKENNPVIYLNKSQVIFSGANDPLQLGHIKVVASDSSAVLFHDNMQVNTLDVQLAHSSLKCGTGNIGQLSIVTDSVSRISLQSKHLVKANIKTMGQQ